MKQVITSPANRYIRLARTLTRPGRRRELGLFCLEGLRHAAEVIRSGGQVEVILFRHSLADHGRWRQSIELWQALGVPCWPVADSLFARLSQTETPQGVLAIVKMPAVTWTHLLLRPDPFLLVVDAVQDPGNLGSLLRTAAAARVDGVVLTVGTVDLYNDKVLRASAGEILRLAILDRVSIAEVLARLHEKQIRLVVADPRGETPYFTADLRAPLAIVVGNEAQGPLTELLEAADQRVYIPLANEVDSLNVGVAWGILAYEAARQQGRLLQR
ncbi:MAG: RNA methyltransferase [Clostridia bacterium]|nr:MAG: RNA methyltransferase [Clostridia bacterium]